MNELIREIQELQSIFNFDTQHMIISKTLEQHEFYNALKKFTDDQIAFTRSKKYCFEQQTFLEIINQGNTHVHRAYHRQTIYNKHFNKISIDIVKDLQIPMYHFPGLLSYDTIQHSIICNLKRNQLCISFEIITMNGSDPKYKVCIEFHCDDDVTQDIKECEALFL